MKRLGLVGVVVALGGVTTPALAAPRADNHHDAPSDSWSFECSAPSDGVLRPPIRGPRARVLYLNRDGGTYYPGADDSGRNMSSQIPFLVTPGPWEVDDGTWDQVVTCVSDIFAEFDVDVTDVDPGDVEHQEAVVTTRPGPIAAPSVGGVAPGGYCGGVPGAVVFVFTEVLATEDGSPNPDGVCWVIAHELGHSLGLDHTLLCTDPMSYRGGCEKQFLDVLASCGEADPRDCECGGRAQNSFRRLLRQVPMRGDEPLALGADCSTGQECGSGVCLGSVCTYDCSSDSAAVCPAGFACTDGHCTAALGAGCSTGGAPPHWLWIALVALVVVRRARLTTTVVDRDPIAGRLRRGRGRLRILREQRYLACPRHSQAAGFRPAVLE